MFGSMVLCDYFGSDLQALEVSRNAHKIESIEQLIDRHDIRVMVIKDSIHERLIQNVNYILYNLLI